eukprot:UN2530
MSLSYCCSTAIIPNLFLTRCLSSHHPLPTHGTLAQAPPRHATRCALPRLAGTKHS